MVVVVQRGFAASCSLSFLHLNFFLFLLSVPLLPVSLYLSHTLPEQCFSESVNFYFHFLWSLFPAGNAVNDWGRDIYVQYFSALWRWFFSVLPLRSPLCYPLSLSHLNPALSTLQAHKPAVVHGCSSNISIRIWSLFFYRSILMENLWNFPSSNDAEGMGCVWFSLKFLLLMWFWGHCMKRFIFRRLPFTSK